MQENEKPGNGQDQGHGHDGDHGRRYTFTVNDQTYHVDHSVVTGSEVLSKAGLPQEWALFLVDEGGQRPFGLDESIDLKPGERPSARFLAADLGRGGDQ